MNISGMRPSRRFILCAAALFILGAALRLACLDALPAGLNQDEASAGYDAWAILNYGLDRNLNRLPVLLESWGSGQNALLSYLAMPFIALFGLSSVSVRLPMALAGCLTLALFWRAAALARGGRFGLWALFMLAGCPWHVMASRWALESNLLPACLMAGAYLAALSERRPWALLGAGLAFALALYAYGTAFFLLPGLLVYCLWRLRRSLKPGAFAAAFALFALIAFPIGLCQLRNALGLGGLELFGFTLPELSATRQSAVSVLGGGDVIGAVWDNFKALIRLLLTQTDGLIWNSVGFGGIFTVLGLPLAAAGLARSARDGARSAMEGIMLAWLLLSLACSLLISVNINRVNMLWLPLIYFAALGADWLGGALGRAWGALAAALLACFAGFMFMYASALGGGGNVNFFPGLGEAIEYADAKSEGDVYVTDWVNAPYIFALFYTRTPPEEFAASVEYSDPGSAFRDVEGFALWRFGPAGQAEGDYFILHLSECAGMEAEAVFGQFAVINNTESK